MREPLRANALAQVPQRLRIAVEIRESHPTSIVDWLVVPGSYRKSAFASRSRNCRSVHWSIVSPTSLPLRSKR
jgi:hypothetical protein